MIQSHTLRPLSENSFVLLLCLRHFLVCILYSCRNFISNMVTPMAKFSLDVSFDSVERLVNHLLHRDTGDCVLDLSHMSCPVPVHQAPLQLIGLLLEGVV